MSGGSRDLFLHIGGAESFPGRDQIDVQILQAVQRGDKRAVAACSWSRSSTPMSNRSMLVLKVGDLDPVPLRLEFGDAARPAAGAGRRAAADAAGDRGSCWPTDSPAGGEVPPVRHWELHFLPHSHVDIGYTHVQTEVEQKAVGVLAAGDRRLPATRPTIRPEARFKWNYRSAVGRRQLSAAGVRRGKGSEFLQAVRGGVIHLDGLYGNELTALCRPEELMRLTGCARQISQPIRSDHRCGHDQRRAGLHVGHRAGAGAERDQVPVDRARITCTASASTLEQWGDRPFYWVSPSGDERLLCWMAGKAYSWFHGSRVGTLSRDSQHDPFFEYLDELIEQDYPYDMVQIRYSIGGDNGPPDQELSEFVKAWNEKYVWPRMVISTTSQLDARLRGSLR